MNAIENPRPLKDFAQLLIKKDAKIRQGGKMMIDTTTYKTFTVYTVEIWYKPQRRYLPLQLPGGVWKFDSAEECNEVFQQLLEEGVRS